MAKKRGKKENHVMRKRCDSRTFFIILETMAVTLFLLTFWQGFARALLFVHYAWYLGLTVLLAILLLTKNSLCGKK